MYQLIRQMQEFLSQSMPAAECIIIDYDTDKIYFEVSANRSSITASQIEKIKKTDCKIIRNNKSVFVAEMFAIR